MSLPKAIKSLELAHAIRSVRFDAQKPGFGDVNTFSLTLDTKTIGKMEIGDLRELVTELNDVIRPVLDRYAFKFVEQATNVIESEAVPT